MKTFSLIFLITVALGGCVFAAELLRGEYAELHDCELYTGGCTASAQATQDGRSVLRVWNFEAGSGELSGLTVAVLEIADGSLAMPGTTAKSAVAYLPEGASAAQGEALLFWLKDNDVRVTRSLIKPIEYSRDGAVISFAAGDGIGFSTREIEHCDAGSCGEQLWYSPRGKTGDFTVLVNEVSHVKEPALQLLWKDHSSKSVFFGRFGTSDPATFTLAVLR
jgi:hypothetical protein